jgi:hypothetical protein
MLAARIGKWCVAKIHVIPGHYPGNSQPCCGWANAEPLAIAGQLFIESLNDSGFLF